MKDTLLAFYAKVQPYAAKLYSWSPFVTGMLLGYFGKPLIQFTLSLIKL